MPHTSRTKKANAPIAKSRDRYARNRETKGLLLVDDVVPEEHVGMNERARGPFVRGS